MKLNSRGTDLTCALMLPIALAAVVLVNQVGCDKGSSEPLPKTFPVTGEIVDKAGRPMTLGAIEFDSVADEKMQAVGKIQADGTFTLVTVIGKSMVPGAIEGSHNVTFLPGNREQLPHYFKQQFKVGPGENHIKLQYPYGQ